MAPTGIEIGFNARYLLDILGEIDGDTVEVHLADAAAPTLLRENDKCQRALRADADAGVMICRLVARVDHAGECRRL